MTNAPYEKSRSCLVKWLRQQVIGPANKAEEILRISPLERYPTGVLYPVEPGFRGVDPASGNQEEFDPALLEEDEDEGEKEDSAEGREFGSSVRQRRYVPPSSVGFSFFVRGRVELYLTASAAIYRSNGVEGRDERGQFKSVEYAREALAERTTHWSDAGNKPEAGFSLWDGRAALDINRRPHRDGCIITVSLCNRRELDSNTLQRVRSVDRVGKSLFEVELSCVVECGEVQEYPRVDPSLLSNEEQELELQYRKQRIYAVGHGAAANWKVLPSDKPRIWCEFMPDVEVPMMAVNTGGDDSVLSIERLAKSATFSDLNTFIDGYADWANNQQREAASFANRNERDAADRICQRMQTALGRMRQCVEVLRGDRLVAESFRIANRAMLDQMRQAHLVSRQGAGEDSEESEYRWRPFQLAFLLTVLVSTVREDDDFRDKLDLIWFPTGGGKTEAYLGLIAFLIAYRRQKYPDTGGGTTAFMRYTLRLLTSQQFQRASRLVCALELIRRRNPEQLGEEPITIGLWVGSDATPNQYEKAMEVLGEIRDGNPNAAHKLSLVHCPWCGAGFDKHDSYHATNREFYFRCINPRCDFGVDRSELPCSVVDDALYDNPPTLLIGTIDKFARLAWEEEAGAFFGSWNRAKNRSFRPPELIIQDELHLITGPLGSVAGLYEAGVDTLLSVLGVRPKYVASTATIRMAAEQAKCLYARDLEVFPPPGLSFDDTYFARADHERPGRLYVGYLAPLLDQQHCMAPLAAALLVGRRALFEDESDSDDLLDAWWTQVVYHGSLKGVGNSHTAFDSDVRDIVQRFAKELRQLREQEFNFDLESTAALLAPAQQLKLVLNREQNPQVVQLKSRKTARENAETFQRLERNQTDDACVDAVLATNMVSVGLDIERLALMIVNGQPLTTAEYIQATSRVGRGAVPGLVVANYYRHQVRSLSHYESFRSYHESFYRYVEPSSVTPFTFQVRTRALHAAVVIALRHGCEKLRSNKSAGEFRRGAIEVESVIEKLKRRCEQAMVGAVHDQLSDFGAHLDQLTQQWHDEARRCKDNKEHLEYRAFGNNKNANRLLYSHDEERRGLWPTLHSMRNVEGTGSLKVHDYQSRQ